MRKENTTRVSRTSIESTKGQSRRSSWSWRFSRNRGRAKVRISSDIVKDLIERGDPKIL
jgi:hypothetical protein